MPVQVVCSQCGRKGSAPDAAIGRRAKCPACGNVDVVPDPSGDTEFDVSTDSASWPAPATVAPTPVVARVPVPAPPTVPVPGPAPVAMPAIDDDPFAARLSADPDGYRSPVTVQFPSYMKVALVPQRSEPPEPWFYRIIQVVAVIIIVLGVGQFVILTILVLASLLGGSNSLANDVRGAGALIAMGATTFFFSFLWMAGSFITAAPILLVLDMARNVRRLSWVATPS